MERRLLFCLLVGFCVSGCHDLTRTTPATDASLDTSSTDVKADEPDTSSSDLTQDVQQDLVHPPADFKTTDVKVDSAKSPDLILPDVGSGCKHPTVVKNCTAGWCTIPTGCFVMGSPTTEPCRVSDEAQHQVTLTHKFEIMATEVSQAQYLAWMGSNPSYFNSCSSGSCPVEQVTWHDAVTYCNVLSSKKSLTQCYICSSGVCSESTTYAGAKFYTCPGYRLPTEAEWEYAYRAGTTTAFYSGSVSSCTTADTNASLIGWYSQNSSNKTWPVGQKTPNAWGLYDMAGNVWEWINDWYGGGNSAPVTNPIGPTAGTTRVQRSGSFIKDPNDLRAAARRGWNPAQKNDDWGFRCVRTLP